MPTWLIVLIVLFLGFVLMLNVGMMGFVLWMQTQVQPIGPTPGPAPLPTDLASLIPDPAERAHVGGFFRDFAIAVENGALTNTRAVRDSYRVGVGIMKQTGGLAVSQIEQPVNQILVAQIGLDDKQLDTTTRAKVVNAYRQVAHQLGVK